MHRRPRFLLPLALLVAVLAAAPAAFAGAERANVVYWSTDFDSGIPPEFSAPGAAPEGIQGWAGLGPPGNQFGGLFLRYSALPLYDTKLVLRNLPAHTHVSVGFLLALIDSWDGAELYRVSVDGQMLFNHWFQLATGDTSDYPPPPGALLSAGTNLGFTNSGYHYRDRAYDLSVEPAFQNIPHTADSLVVNWYLGAVSGSAASQWQAGADESWAIDNVRVTLHGTTGADGATPPARLALASAGVNPSRDGRLRLRFALPGAGAARLEVFDVGGRRVAAREVGALGAGSHVATFGDDAPLPPGLYLARLTRGSASSSARVVVTR